MMEETGIVWLEDPRAFPYVREGRWMTWGERVPARGAFHRLIGYAEVAPDPRRARAWVWRRVWYLCADDRSECEDSPHARQFPAEAVDPYSVKPNRPSRWLARSAA